MTRTTHDEFVHENRRISQTAIAENFNTGTVSINVNIARLTRKGVLDCNSLSTQ